MQNMEKYFGFRVIIANSMNPADKELLREAARSYFQDHNLRSEEYKAYVHNLVISSKEKHFGFSGFENRVDRLFLSFVVNQKQRENGAIRFIHHQICGDKADEMDYFPEFTPDRLRYTIPSSEFVNKPTFTNSILTLIRSDLRESHRKIKVEVRAEPQQKFKWRIKRVEGITSDTKLDIRYHKSVELPLFNNKNQMNDANQKQNLSKPENTNIFNIGQANQVGVNPSISGKTITLGISVDTTKLGIELQQLHDFLAIEDIRSQENTSMLAALSDAANNAKNGDERGLATSLKKLPRWIVGKAEQLGVHLAAAAIKSQLGI